MFKHLRQTHKPLVEDKPAVEDKFIMLTRVYSKNRTEVKTQPIVLAISEIESFRPRNKIGTKENGNRCTIVTTSGKYINVTEKFSEVLDLLTR